MTVLKNFANRATEGPYHQAQVSDGMDLSNWTLKENVRRISKALVTDPLNIHDTGFEVVNTVTRGSISGSPLQSDLPITRGKRSSMMRGAT